MLIDYAMRLKFKQKIAHVWAWTLNKKLNMLLHLNSISVNICDWRGEWGGGEEVCAGVIYMYIA